MTIAPSANRWAADLTRLLDQVYATDTGRFPVNVKTVAKDFSAQRFPGDAISMVKGADLGKFDGALYRAPAGKAGWGIIYNNALSSPGRINFTLAHEFGHYLLHRLIYPRGIECGAGDIARGDSAYAAIEKQANSFAAGMLMPFNDFRSQLPSKAKPSFVELGACAERYGTSLLATTLRWLEYSERRSLLVVSRDGYVLWSRASGVASRTGIYFRTAGRPPISLPAASLAASVSSDARRTAEHDDRVWFDEPCQEVSLVADRYDFTVSLLHFDSVASAHDDEYEPDVVDLMSMRGR